MKKTSYAFTAVSAIMIALACSATAQSNGPLAACKEDIQDICGAVQPGGGRIRECMKDNYQKLSPQCRDAIRDARAARAQGSAGEDSGRQAPASGQDSGADDAPSDSAPAE